ncbi:MAG TPA: nitroreductase family protein [Longimicrobium sp.]|jgi:nitroreductase
MNDTTIDFLSVREAAEKRRSIRSYEPGLIPREELEEILDVARRAPSAFNVQPWRFVVVETPELKAQLAAAAFNQRQVHSAPAVIVLYTDMEDALGNLDAVVHPGMSPEQQQSTIATVRRMFDAQPVEERETWGAGQGYIALGYLLLAAEARGYQTSPMTGFDPARVKELLGLPGNARIPALVAIGHAAEEGFPQHRLPLDSLLRVA